MNFDPVIACTLGPGDFQTRMRWIADLNGRHLKAQRRDGLTLHLSYQPAALEDVRELVRRETECCAFLTFALAEAPGAGLDLHVFAANTAARGVYARMGGVEGPLEKEIAPDGSRQAYCRVWWPDPTILLEPA